MRLGEVLVCFSIVIASLVIVAQRFGYSWVAHSTTGVVFSWISVISLVLILDAVALFPDFPLSPLSAFRVLPGNAPDDAILGHILTLSASNTILLLYARTYNSCCPTQE